MKIIPTNDLVIEEVHEAIHAYTIVASIDKHHIEPFSDTKVSLTSKKPSYKYMDVIEKSSFSNVDGFRCYDTFSLARFFANQYYNVNNIECKVYPVVIPYGAHVIRNNGVIFCNEWIINGD